jgi:hypothetical protein
VEIIFLRYRQVVSKNHSGFFAKGIGKGKEDEFMLFLLDIKLIRDKAQ